jgi:hypothetical protein
MPQQPLRKSDVELLEALERGQNTGVFPDEEALERLVKLGMLEERRRGVLSLTPRGRTYVQRRKAIKRGGKKPGKERS